MNWKISNRAFWATILLIAVGIGSVGMSTSATGRQEESKPLLDGIRQQELTGRTEWVNPTRIGKFIEGKGSLVFQNRKELGTVEGKGSSEISLTVISSYLPDQPDERASGFLVTMADRKEGINFFYSAYIDDDEARNLSLALKMMASEAEKIKGKDVGEKRFRFAGTDAYFFSVEHFKNPAGRVDQQFWVFPKYQTYPSVLMKGADGYQKLAAGLDSGLEWLKAQQRAGH